jgi:hypothetical protein
MLIQRKQVPQVEPSRPPCPYCRGDLTRRTFATTRGEYRLCDGCGHIWHHAPDEPVDKRVRQGH